VIVRVARLNRAEYVTGTGAYLDWLRRPRFDLKRWHTAALSLGPIGLDGLAGELARV
jgi:hypothetical protein